MRTSILLGLKLSLQVEPMSLYTDKLPGAAVSALVRSSSSDGLSESAKEQAFQNYPSLLRQTALNSQAPWKHSSPEGGSPSRGRPLSRLELREFAPSR